MPKMIKKRSKRAGVNVSESSFLPAILKSMQELSKVEVHVGAAADLKGSQEIAMIAGVHEYGSKKMGIPARSFIRTGKTKAQAAASKVAKIGVNAIVQKNETVKSLMDKLGQVALQRTQLNFDKLRTPPLTARYAKQRKKAKILVQEQKLRDSLAYIVVPKGRGK